MAEQQQILYINAHILCLDAQYGIVCCWNLCESQELEVMSKVAHFCCVEPLPEADIEIDQVSCAATIIRKL